MVGRRRFCGCLSVVVYYHNHGIHIFKVCDEARVMVIDPL